MRSRATGCRSSTRQPIAESERDSEAMSGVLKSERVGGCDGRMMKP